MKKTQKQIAQEVGISESYLSLILSGKRIPESTKTIVRIARVMGLSVEKLLNRCESLNSNK